MLGGFHFNDRRYADDDLTLGSIDPTRSSASSTRSRCFEWETGRRAGIAYMVDQSHNLKDKIEEMIQTAVTAQELYAKAALVDHEALAGYQTKCGLVDAEECLKEAFSRTCGRLSANGGRPTACRGAAEGFPRERLSATGGKGAGGKESELGFELRLVSKLAAA